MSAAKPSGSKICWKWRKSALKKKLPPAGPKAPAAFILIDRLVVKEFDEDDRHRIADSVTTAFYEGEGEMLLEINGDRRLPFSNRFELDGLSFEEPVPNLFSFNNPYGACPTCEGFSQVLGIDADLVIPDKRLSVYEGAIAPWKGEKLVWWRDQFIKAAKKFDFPVHKPIIDLTKQQYKTLWEGNEHAQGINDFFAEVERNLYKVQYRVLLIPISRPDRMPRLQRIPAAKGSPVCKDRRPPYRRTL